MKLEIKHIAPYLPYRINPLKIVYGDGVCTLEGISGGYNLELRHGQLVSSNINIESVKPILKPMSQVSELFKYFIDVMPFGQEYKSRLFFEEKKHTEKTDLFWIKSSVAMELMINKSSPLTSPYLAVEVMIKNHFDVFGLINAGLAIDINTL